MTLKEILKKYDFARLVHYDSWLIYEQSSEDLVVYKRTYYQKMSRVIYRGKDEKTAIEILTTE